MMSKFLLAAACGVIIASAMPAAAAVTITNSVKQFDKDGVSLFQQSGSANIFTDDYEAAGFVDPISGPNIDAYVTQTNSVFSAEAKSMLRYNFYIGCTVGQSCSVTPDHPLTVPVLVDYSLFAHPGWDFSDTSASIDVTDGFGDSFHRGLACSSDSDPCDDITATGRLDFVVSYIDGDGHSHGSTLGTVLMQAQAHGNSENNGLFFSGEAGVDPTLYIDPAFLIDHPGYTLTTDTVLFGDAPGVPEPATWVLMLLGFGGLGVALRTRHRTVTAQG